MATKASTEEKDDADLDDANASEEDRDEAGSSEEDQAEDRSSDDGAAKEGDEDEKAPAPLARKEASDVETSEEGEEEGDEKEEAAAQLGIQRYVLASFFAAGIVAAYVFGRAIQGLWSWAANKDWFHNALPSLAAVDDDKKATWGTVLGAIIALLAVIRTYRRPSVRAWADEVATELAKVKWPSRKEVSSSTVVVIAAGAIATLYLALLDRLWSFVTDLFYGTGS
jgi:preprotein translocase subunit SecE